MLKLLFAHACGRMGLRKRDISSFVTNIISQVQMRKVNPCEYIISLTIIMQMHNCTRLLFLRQRRRAHFGYFWAPRDVRYHIVDVAEDV